MLKSFSRLWYWICNIFDVLLQWESSAVVQVESTIATWDIRKSELNIIQWIILSSYWWNSKNGNTNDSNRQNFNKKRTCVFYIILCVTNRFAEVLNKKRTKSDEILTSSWRSGFCVHLNAYFVKLSSLITIIFPNGKTEEKIKNK